MRKLIKSFGYAFKGISVASLDQLNIKIHWLAVIIVTIAGFFFHISITEWCLVIICFSTVLAAELFNSASETIVDLVSPDHHPLAGKAKDIAAGAVLVTAIGAALVAFLIFWKYLMAFLGLKELIF